MNVLFLGYWGANEGLSQSTINPHLQILAGLDQVNRIIYVSMEREDNTAFNIPIHAKIDHMPYKSPRVFRFLNKVIDFTLLPLKLARYLAKYDIDLLMCRSSLAGGIGYLATVFRKTPFTVESFEPHGSYMVDLGVWSEKSVSYKLVSWLESRQLNSAKHIMPVSHTYAKKLSSMGVPECKVSVLPCCVDLDKFKYSSNTGASIRKTLGLSSDAVVGIYVGKFGGIYLEEEAFRWFENAFSQIEDFYLIILTPQNPDFLYRKASSHSIPVHRIFITKVPHEQVPSYLSAADFAFSLHKPIQSAIAYSPIKNGEYWANGLYTVISDGIGDDSKAIENYQMGLVISNVDSSYKFNKLISRDRENNRQVLYAAENRNFSVVEIVYEGLVSGRVK